MIKKGLVVYQQEGLIAFLRRAKECFGLETRLIFYHSTLKTVPPFTYPIKMIYVSPGLYRFSVMINNLEAAYALLAITKVAQKQIDYYGVPVDYANGEALLGGTFTNPEYRGRGFQKALIYAELKFLKHLYFRWGIGSAEKSNTISIRNQEIIGGIRVEQITAVKFANKIIFRFRKGLDKIK